MSPPDPPSRRATWRVGNSLHAIGAVVAKPALVALAKAQFADAVTCAWGRTPCVSAVCATRSHEQANTTPPGAQAAPRVSPLHWLAQVCSNVSTQSTPSNPSCDRGGMVSSVAGQRAQKHAHTATSGAQTATSETSSAHLDARADEVGFRRHAPSVGPKQALVGFLAERNRLPILVLSEKKWGLSSCEEILYKRGRPARPWQTAALSCHT